MRRILIIATGIVLCSLLCVQCSYAYVKSIESGEVHLEEKERFGDEGAFKISFGDKVKADCKFYIQEFFDEKVITAWVKLKNTTSKKVRYEFYVAFFDEGMKLVGCESAGSRGGLDPLEEKELGGSVIGVPHTEFSKVKYYQAVLYAAETIDW